MKESLLIFKNRELYNLLNNNYKLSWNFIRDYLIYQGINNIVGSRDAIKLAYKYNIIRDGQVRIEIINSRNLTSHTYNKKIVDKILKDIVEKYYLEFEFLYDYFKRIADEEAYE